MIRRILVPVDGSCHAEAALAAGIEIAEGLKAELEILCVGHFFPGFIGQMPAAGMAVEELEQETEREAQEIVAAALKRVPESITVHSKAVIGHPVTLILEEIEKGKCDLVIMGRRGRSGVAAFFLGSVSQAVMHKSTVPVMV